MNNKLNNLVKEEIKTTRYWFIKNNITSPMYMAYLAKEALIVLTKANNRGKNLTIPQSLSKARKNLIKSFAKDIKRLMSE